MSSDCLNNSYGHGHKTMPDHGHVRQVIAKLGIHLYNVLHWEDLKLTVEGR